MSRKTDLEESMRECYEIIVGNEKIRRLSNRPQEKLRAQQIIAEQWDLIRNYLFDYVDLGGDTYPPDIAEIAVHFKGERRSSRNDEKMFSEKKKDDLKRLLSQHQENLRELELQKALYGVDVPLHLINAIKHEEAEIERIKGELGNLGESSTEM